MSNSKISVEEVIRSSPRPLCLPLLDPITFRSWTKEMISPIAKDSPADAFLVGGSTLASSELLGDIISKIKTFTDKPVVIFPNNITAISKLADGILYLVLMNSDSLYYVMDAQVLSAPLILEYSIEAIPTGYIVLNPDSSVSFIGRVRPIPRKPELISLYAAAAKLFRFPLLYLEGGSGTSEPVQPELVAAAKKYYNGLLLVGGGIVSYEQARALVKAGADGIVIGNLIETPEGINTFRQICSKLKQH